MSYEQQIQAGIRSLPDTWEHMRHNMAHNENIKTFNDPSRHLELEAECLKTAKANGSSYITQSDSRKPSGPKRKNNQNEKNGNPGLVPKKDNATKRKRDKRGGKKGKTSTSCFNCGN